ncbi:MAG TPA: hypothetical protein VK674_06105 [Candidatus Limnocylindria bacterium]|nr:hypothetical protein [Candidatus Limnocylindria bacterium]
MGQFRQVLVHQNIHFLKQNKLRLVALSFVAATLFSVSLPLGTTLADRRPRPTNHNNIVSSSEVKNALQTVPGVLDASDQVATRSDADSAATTNVNGTTVDVPKDAEQGVTFGTGSTKLDIKLPNAENATTAKQVAPGVVGYDSGNGSANAVQPTEDGGVRMLTVIDNPNAPTAYEYRVSIPSGGSVQLRVDGGALVINKKQRVITSVDKPWAKDATGKSVNTYFTTDGKTLTQHVEHNVPGVVYPVMADPWWKPWTWTRKTWKRITKTAIAGGSCAVSFVAAPTIWVPLSICSMAAAGLWVDW